MSVEPWVIGACINLAGSVSINVGTNLIKYHHTHYGSGSAAHRSKQAGGRSRAASRAAAQATADEKSNKGSTHSQAVPGTPTSSKPGRHSQTLAQPRKSRQISLEDEYSQSVHSHSHSNSQPSAAANSLRPLTNHPHTSSSVTSSSAAGEQLSQPPSPHTAARCSDWLSNVACCWCNGRFRFCLLCGGAAAASSSGSTKSTSWLSKLVQCIRLPFQRLLRSTHTSKSSTNCFWWFGFLFFLCGNIANFISFAFAAQSLLAALGSVQFISNVVCSVIVLRQAITRQTLLATSLIVLGNLLIVVFASHSSQHLDVDDLFLLYFETAYKIYLILLLATVIVLYIFYKEAKQRVRDCELLGVQPSVWSLRLIPCAYASISAIIGTQSVLLAKSSAELIRITISGQNQFVYPFTYLILVGWFSTMVFWLYRMNSALRKFDGAFIIPVLQVVWTLFSIVGGGVYFKEFNDFDAVQIGLFTLGVAVVIVGVFLLAPSSHNAHTHHHSSSIETTLSNMLSSQKRRVRTRTRSDADSNHPLVEIQLADLQRVITSRQFGIQSLILSRSPLASRSAEKAKVDRYSRHASRNTSGSSSPAITASPGTSLRRLSAMLPPTAKRGSSSGVLTVADTLRSQASSTNNRTSPRHAIYGITAAAQHSSQSQLSNQPHHCVISPRKPTRFNGATRSPALAPVPEPMLQDEVDIDDAPDTLDGVNQPNAASTDTGGNDAIAATSAGDHRAHAHFSFEANEADNGNSYPIADEDGGDEDYVTVEFDPPVHDTAFYPSVGRTAWQTLIGGTPHSYQPVVHRPRGLSLGFSMPTFDLDQSTEESEASSGEYDSSESSESRDEELASPHDLAVHLP